MSSATAPELFDLSGKVAVVTGGTRGIGLELAEGLAEAGAAVAVTGRREPWLSEAQEHLRSVTDRAISIEADARDSDVVDRLVDAVGAEFGPIDILVNSAGISWGAPAVEMPIEKWDDVMAVNAKGTFLFCQAVGRQMVDRGTGRIINIASIAAFVSPITQLRNVGYAASKGAVVALTRSLAVEWGPLGITVNAIAPWWFVTRLSEAYLAEHEKEVTDITPMARLGRPGELKGVGVFLASDAASYVTGQVIIVDGGYTAT